MALVTFTWNQRFCEQGPLVLRISFYTDQSKEGGIVKGTRVFSNAKGKHILNPLTPNIKEQILLSYLHTFTYWGEVIKISRKFTLSDHILNSHDLRG